MSTSSMVTTACDTFKYTRCYCPQCSLAVRIVDKMHKQRFRAPQIIKAMGYPVKHSIAANDRLRYVLNSPNIGLDGSYIDAYYDAKGFVITLCELLDIEPSYYNQQINTIVSAKL
ncbi:hypothetical protein [Psychrobacter sp.]|uniref:hypothetical protein n=1 Tax=Psychrobacter sp. TaxID=56811 RepID=UPI0025EDF38B|nr:hypothetical protein [Psychrobacter sp.]